jgi:hypothetical protein
MIRYHDNAEGHMRPVMLCDVCNKPIRHHEEGGYAWLTMPGTTDFPPEGAEVFHVHKGKCFAKVEQYAKEQKSMLLDLELSDFVVLLCDALKISPKTLRARKVLHGIGGNE